MRRTGLASALCAFAACDWSLQRMMDQNRCDPDEPSALFANGECNQTPPEQTVPYALPAEPHTSNELTRAFVERGRDRFELFCATCHGLLGDGRSEVAENMALRRPPALTDPRIEQMSDDYLAAVIARGFGLMPSYNDVLDEHDRRAIVAYVRALWLSQNASLAALPPSVREEALRWLR